MSRRIKYRKEIITTELIARRQFAPLYIWLDLAFLMVFLLLLLWKKKYMTVLVGLVMGIVYMLVATRMFPSSMF